MTKKSNEEFIDEVRRLSNNTMYFNGKYTNNKTPLEFHCKICRHTWMLRPDKFLYGRRCPKCANMRRTKTDSTFKKEVYNSVGDEYYFLDNYVNSYTKIRVKHNICNRVYYVSPHNFLDMKNRCPFCSHSKGEICIVDWLYKHNIKYMREWRPVWIKPKRYRYDFYLPKYNLIIEYHGIQHYEDNDWFHTRAIKYQEIDALKYNKALEMGFNYLIIPYWEYDNIENILKEKLEEE